MFRQRVHCLDSFLLRVNDVELVIIHFKPVHVFHIVSLHEEVCSSCQVNRVLNGELKPNHLLLLSHENSTKDGDLLGVIALQSFKLGDVTGLT